jgi:hypothetical protein
LTGAAGVNQRNRRDGRERRVLYGRRQRQYQRYGREIRGSLFRTGKNPGTFLRSSEPVHFLKKHFIHGVFCMNRAYIAIWQYFLEKKTPNVKNWQENYEKEARHGL